MDDPDDVDTVLVTDDHRAVLRELESLFQDADLPPGEFCGLLMAFVVEVAKAANPGISVQALSSHLCAVVEDTVLLQMDTETMQ